MNVLARSIRSKLPAAALITRSVILGVMRATLIVGFGLLFAVDMVVPARADFDLGTLQSQEIKALQRRLSDAGCYSGPIDGLPSSAMSDAAKACPDQSPVLRIETGMHIGTINRVAVDPSCSLIVTGSDDKTVRVWSLPDLTLKRTLRLPIEGGSTGKIYAVAISPNGRLVASGGEDAGGDRGLGYAIYVTDLSTNATQRFGSFEGEPSVVAFSPDGRLIAVGLGDGGLRVLNGSTGHQQMADKDYGGTINGLVFGPDGSLYSSSWDGFIRRYGQDLKQINKTKAPDGIHPNGIAIDPAGHWLAIGYADAAVSVLDARSLKTVSTSPSSETDDAGLLSLAWTKDGSSFLAGGLPSKTTDGSDLASVRRFSQTGQTIGQGRPISNSIIEDLKPCSSFIAFAAADPRFGLLKADGSIRATKLPVTANMRGKLDSAFVVSKDGMSVQFGLGFGNDSPVLFDLSLGQLVDAPESIYGLDQAIVDGLPITDWKHNTQPALSGEHLPLNEFELSNALAIRPDRSGFVLGTSWYLRAFDSDGHQRWAVSEPSETWGVNFAAEGKLVVAAHNDGTVRWYRGSDGRELLSLFVHAPTKRWVAWTPTGYFIASPGAEDLIGWHVNRGWTQEADFFPASRLRDKFSRPDIVRLVLRTLDEDDAIKQANEVSQRRDDQTSIIEQLPPVVTIMSPQDGDTIPPGVVHIRYGVRTPSGLGVDRIEAFVDGAKIEARGLGPSPADPAATLDLPMPAHDAVISIVAYAGGKASDAARIQLKGAPLSHNSASADADEALLKPNLYAVLIGVTHYENKAYDLAYPAQDATGVAEALKGQEGKFYRHVEVKVLTDKDATAIAVKKALLWLQRQTTARDLAIVFAAGHGMTDTRGRFWFLTTDADPDALSVSALSKDDIADVLYDLPGKKLLFLDACHSGAALSEGTRGVEQTDLSAAVNDFAQTEGGVVAYAASTGREYSFENEQWGHGAFTKALIEGFEGKADGSHRGTVTTATLDLYIEDRVKVLTAGRQHPVMTRPKTIPDFPIAAVP